MEDRSQMANRGVSGGPLSDEDLAGAEQAILLAGEKLDSAMWEMYLLGDLNRADFQRGSELISAWMRQGEKLLEELPLISGNLYGGPE